MANLRIFELQVFLAEESILEAISGTRLYYSYDDAKYPPGKPGERRLYFKARNPYISGHYVVRQYYQRTKKEVTYDTIESYRLKYQKDGSNGLCMVFAAMIFRKETGDLIKGNLFHNTKVALRWAYKRLSEQKKIKPTELFIWKKSKEYEDVHAFTYTINKARKEINEMLNNDDFIWAIATEQDMDSDYDEESENDEQEIDEPVRRGRGRPRRGNKEIINEPVQRGRGRPRGNKEINEPVKRGRGRPRKMIL